VAVVFSVQLGRRRFLPSKFSCHRADEGSINEALVKRLLLGRGDLSPLERVGSWRSAYAFLLLANCPKNEPVDQAQAAGLTTADFAQITAGGNDHGRQRQTKN
jgi:hypothetical protein